MSEHPKGISADPGRRKGEHVREKEIWIYTHTVFLLLISSLSCILPLPILFILSFLFLSFPISYLLVFCPIYIYFLIYIYIYYLYYILYIYIYYFSYPYPILPILPTSFIKRVSAVTLGSVWSFSGYVSGTKSASMDFRKDVRHFFGAILWFVRPSVPCCFAAGRCFSCSSVGMLLNALFKLFFRYLDLCLYFCPFGCWFLLSFLLYLWISEGTLGTFSVQFCGLFVLPLLFCCREVLLVLFARNAV